jgi:two-component system response regulator BaeR
MNKTKPTILIVEDEQKLAIVLGEYFTQIDYLTHWIDNGTEVLPWIRSHSPDLILLDLMLPDKDGLSIFRELRTFSQIPVIIVTAKIDEIDRLLGLELGADDYICKPYSPREVVVRAKNVLRRTSPSLIEAQGGSIEMNLLAMTAEVNGQILDLTPSEFRLLKLFFNNVNRVYSREQLLDHIYDNYRIVTDRTIDNHIKNLRKKLKEALPEENVIKSVYGAGYKLDMTAAPKLINKWSWA